MARFLIHSLLFFFVAKLYKGLGMEQTWKGSVTFLSLIQISQPRRIPSMKMQFFQLSQKNPTISNISNTNMVVFFVFLLFKSSQIASSVAEKPPFPPELH